MEAQGIFPCWGKFERMGHDVTYGHFEVFDGTVLSVRIPGLDARDDEHPETKEERRLVQLGGAAFYGFTVLDEESVYQRLQACRPWKPAPRKALPAPVEDDPYEADPYDQGGEE